MEVDLKDIWARYGWPVAIVLALVSVFNAGQTYKEVKESVKLVNEFGARADEMMGIVYVCQGMVNDHDQQIDSVNRSIKSRAESNNEKFRLIQNKLNKILGK